MNYCVKRMPLLSANLLYSMCLVGGHVGNLYRNFNSSHYSAIPVLFTVIQNLLTAAAISQAATGVLIISQSGVFYLPPSLLTVSMGVNGDIFLIKIREGEYKLPGNEVPGLPKICAHWRPYANNISYYGCIVNNSSPVSPWWKFN